jgi:hypothetical protein
VAAAALVTPTAALGADGASPLVDTGQGTCYDDSGEQISCLAADEAF